MKAVPIDIVLPVNDWHRLESCCGELDRFESTTRIVKCAQLMTGIARGPLNLAKWFRATWQMLGVADIGQGTPVRILTITDLGSELVYIPREMEGEYT